MREYLPDQTNVFEYKAGPPHQSLDLFSSEKQTKSLTLFLLSFLVMFIDITQGTLLHFGGQLNLPQPAVPELNLGC